MMHKSQLPKMIKKLYLYLLLLCSLTGLESYAQTFPIRITTQLTQPSPIYLSNYANANTVNSPIKIQLVLNDLTISNRQVRLKIYFQGNGMAFSTNDFVVGAKQLYLEGGFPLQLTNVDLAPYFEYQNLLGLTPNQYAQPLPEGVYNIYVEVYDFATGKKLSSKTGTPTIIFQNEPPFLNMPLNNASFVQQNIQNIVFGWTPRSINVSNVEYEFSLVEIWDKYTPVQNAFAYSPPLYTTTTRITSLQYGINEPQLIPGRKYAWRVKAKALLGVEEIGVFKNNGYSEIFSFDYEKFCTAPVAIKTESISENQAKITWSGNIDNFDYQVNYREKNAGSEWYNLVTPRENLTISNLKPNTTYEYTVGASCDVGKYTHSTINEFTTLVQDEIAFQGCGIKPDPNDLSNQNPLPELFPNDVISAGDFPIVVMNVTGSNGTFSGDGYVTLPFVEKFRKVIDAVDAFGGEKVNMGQFSRIKITFSNIGVNTDFKLISGEIIAGYDPNWGGIIDGDKLVDDIANLVDEYDPIMESIFGPKPKPEDIAQEDDDENEELNTSKPTETQTENPPIVIVEVNEPQPSPQQNANNNIPEKNNTKEGASSAPSNGAVTENGYYIQYKGQKYYNGGRIKIPYSRHMEETFEMKDVPNDTKVTYSIYQPGEKSMWRGYDSSTSKSTFPIEDAKRSDNLLKQDLQAEATSIEGTPKIRVEVEKIVEKFTQNKLTATNIPNSITTPRLRIASAGQTLYFVSKPGKTNHRNVEIKVNLSQADINRIPKDQIKWKMNDIENKNKDGVTLFNVPLADNNKVLDYKFTNISGYPNVSTKDVSIKWVDEDFHKNSLSIASGNFKNPLIKKAFEATKMTEAATKFFDKIPFIKKVKDKGHLSEGGISYFYNIIPFEEEYRKKEDLVSRLYYEETTTTGGFEIGINGKATIWTIGLPFDKLPLPQWSIDKIKKVVTAEIKVVASASSSGEIKAVVEERLYVESKTKKTTKSKIDPAIVKLDIGFGVESEFSIGGNNDYLSGGIEASGLAKAELFRIGYYDETFSGKLLKNGVFIEIKASGFINTLGKKWETEKYNEKITVIKPLP